MNGTKVFEGRCKLHLYFSPLEKVDLKNCFNKDKDYCSTEQSSNADHEYASFDGQLCVPNLWSAEFKKYKTADQYCLEGVINTVHSQQPPRSVIENSTGCGALSMPAWYYSEQLA